MLVHQRVVQLDPSGIVNTAAPLWGEALRPTPRLSQGVDRTGGAQTLAQLIWKISIGKLGLLVDATRWICI